MFNLMMDGMIGPEFEKGLVSIKELAENDVAVSSE
jgi:hypothetical protein